MSTPTSNSVPVTNLDTSSLSTDLAALIEGVKWGGGWGTGVALTYSFPGQTGSGYHIVPYSSANEWSDWFYLNSSQQAVVRGALGAWATFANVSFTQVSDDQNTVGDLRFAGSSLVPTSNSAYTYFPSSAPAGGDVWFGERSDGTGWMNTSLNGAAPGTFNYYTALHEIGHALGLKHPFEGAVTLDSAHDYFLYSIMSYDVKENTAASSISADFYPTTPMYLDVQAIEALYGTPAVNTGNTVYTFYGTKHYWETINDTGGTDTVNYVSSTGGRIDLSNATFCELGQPIHFSDNTVQYDDVCFGPNVVIEKATGGSGSDTIIGNSVNNVLKGGAGNDSISAGGGNDTIYGDTGNDTLNGGAGTDTAMFSDATSAVAVNLSLTTVQIVGGGLGSDKLSAIENLTGSKFNDTLTGSNGNNLLSGAAGNDKLSGGNGNDTLLGGAGSDSLSGGAGNDIFRYTAISDSDHTTYDKIGGFDALADKFDLWFKVTGINAALNKGALSASTFDANLTADLTSSKLGAHHAVLFTPSSGTDAHDVFLVVDANGTAGYQAGADLVMLLTSGTHLTSLSTTDFI